MTSICGRIPFEVLHTAPYSAAENMQTDINLLDSLKSNPRVIVHIYSWASPSATYGYFLEPSRFFHHQVIDNKALDIARRPTGGGIIFHHCDLAYAVLIPAVHPGYSLNTLDNYAFVNLAVAESIQIFLGETLRLDLLQHEGNATSAYASQFCMAKPTIYDVLFQGRKVGGGAQRRTRYGFLHQGTLCLRLPTQDFISEILLFPQDIVKAMETQSRPLLGHNLTTTDFEAAKNKLLHHLIASLKAKIESYYV